MHSGLEKRSKPSPKDSGASRGTQPGGPLPNCAAKILLPCHCISSVNGEQRGVTHPNRGVQGKKLK